MDNFLAEQIFPSPAAKKMQRAYVVTCEKLTATRAKNAVIVFASPAEYLGALLATVTAQCAVYCGNPHWREQEWREAAQEISADAIWLGDDGTPKNEIIFCGKFSAGDGAKIFIPTGGTGGKVKFVAHTVTSLTAAAQAQCAVLGAQKLDNVNPLPPWHISGIMPVMRALVSGDRVQICDGGFSETSSLPEIFPEVTANFRLLSVVPTQLRRILARGDGAAWLREFDCVLLGGAATAPDLLEQARREKIRVAIGYGMTETAAFVAVHLPDDFLANKPVTGKILPHARIQIVDTNGNPVADGEAGRVVITATSLAENIGVTASDGARFFATQDEGFLRDGQLHLLGRIDRHIVTGGEKVDPRRVEVTLAESPLVKAALVIGEPDAEWGARVVALVELAGSDGDTPKDWSEQLTAHIRARLSRHCIPRRWITVPRLPFNERGKLDRAMLEKILTTDITDEHG